MKKFFKILLLICAAFLFSSCKNVNKFPNNLNEIGFQSIYDSVILNKYKVTDKSLIKEFSNMLNECKFILLTDEEKDNNVSPCNNGVRIVMGDMIFYLNEAGLYLNTKKPEYIFKLEGFDKELFNKVYESREKCQLTNIEAIFPKGLQKLYCRKRIDSFQSVVDDKKLIDDFIEMLQECKLRALTEDEIQKTKDYTIDVIGDYLISTGLTIEDALYFEINEDGYLHEIDSFEPEDIYYLEGFDIDVFNRFIAAKQPSNS